MSIEATEKKDFLGAFENARGLAYLLSTCAIVGPTTIELLLRDRQLFLALDWQKILIVCVAVGGGMYVLAVTSMLFTYAFAASRVRIKTSEARESVTLMMIGGATMSLVFQSIAMLVTSNGSLLRIMSTTNSARGSFFGYVALLAIFAVLLGFTGLIFLMRTLMATRSSRRRLWIMFKRISPFPFFFKERHKNTSIDID